MSTPTRIYVVTDKTTQAKALARASTQASALRSVIADRFEVEVASQEVLVDLITKGAKVIEAGATETTTEDTHD